MANKKTMTLEYLLKLNANPWRTTQEEMKHLTQQVTEKIKEQKDEVARLNKEITSGNADGKDTRGLQKELKEHKEIIKTLQEKKQIYEDYSKAVYQGVDKITKVVMEEGGVMKRSWNQLNEAVKAAQKQLKNFGNTNNMQALEKELAGQGWTGGIDAYQAKLNEFITQAKARMAELQQGFTDLISKINETGATGVEEGHRMLLVLSEMRKAIQIPELKTDGSNKADVDAAKAKLLEVDEAINKVTASMERLAVNSSDVKTALDAIDDSGNVIKGKESLFEKDVNSLERMKASLLAYKRTIDTTGDEGKKEFKKTETAITEVERRLQTTGMSAKRFQQILEGEGPSASMHELEQVIASLELKYKTLAKESQEYNETAMQLRNARKTLSDMNYEMKNHVSSLEQAISRLKSYVLVYMGFNQVLQMTQRWIGTNMELSDSLSDIQKRTRLSDDAIKEISQTIDKIDTRTSQAQLHELAATAGLLGLKAKDDIIGFTKAANELSVALKELGSEGAAQLMKIATLTGDVANFGVEQALVKTGSAINELTASSAASAGPIVNFISRMGAVGSQAKLTMGDLAGIGATLDALGQPIELSATAMNRFIMSVRGNAAGLATALSIDAEQLDNLMQAGKTMEALMVILEKMSEQEGGVAALGVVFDEMGSEGVRLKQTISSLIGNVDFLRTQVAISNQAFEEGTSAINEYNMKNENAAAIMQRTGNMIVEYFTNSDMVDTWKTFAQALQNVVKFFISIDGWLKAGLKTWAVYKTYMLFSEASWRRTSAIIQLSLRHTRQYFSTAYNGLKAVVLGQTSYTTATGLSVTATNRLSLALKAVGLSSPFGLILTAITTLITWAIPSFVSWLGKSNDELEKLKTGTERLAEAQQKYSSIGNGEDLERVRIMKTQIDHLNALGKGTEEYYNARERILAQFAPELKAITERIKGFRDMNEYQEEFISLIDDTNERVRALELSNKLIEAEKAAIAATDAMAGLTMGTKEYEDALKRAQDAANTHNAVLVKMKSEYGQLATALANHAGGLNNITLAYKMLNAEIVNNAKAEAKAASIREESEARNAEWVNFQKEFIDKTTKGFSVAKKSSKTISETEALGGLGVLRDYIYSKDKNAKLTGAAEDFLKQFDVKYFKTYEGEKTGNEVRDLVESIRKKVLESILNEEQISKWEGGRGSMLTPEQESAFFMKTGWARKGYETEQRAQLDRRSELLHMEWNKYASGDDMSKFNEYVGKNFSSYEEATKWVKEVVTEMKDVAKTRGWALAGNWTWPTEKQGRKHQEREADGAIATLDRYYEKRKQTIEKARIEEGLSAAEYNRRMDDLEQEHLKKRSDLRTTFTTDDKKFIQQFRDWWENVAKLDKANWKLIEKEWSKADAKDIETNKLKAEKDLTDMEAITVKHLNEIAKIVSQERPYDTITQNLSDNLTKMGILFADFDAINKAAFDNGEGKIIGDAKYVEQNAERIAWLLNEAEHAYAITIDDLLKSMAESGMEAWANEIAKSDAMKQALMAQLRTVYDAVHDAIKKEATQVKKQMDIAWNDTILESGQSAKQLFEKWLTDVARQEDAVKRANDLINAGYKSEQVADRLALKQMQIKMQMQAAYYAMLRKMWDERIAALKGDDAEHAKKSKNLALSEEQKKIEEQRLAIAAKLEEMQAKLYNSLKEWADLLTDSFKTLFEAANTGNEQFYNERAKLLHEQQKGLASSTEKQTYYIIENAGTSDAKVTEESLTALEALEREHEIEVHNARADAMKKIMDDFNMKMSDLITDQINAMLQNASVDANTAALGNVKAALEDNKAALTDNKAAIEDGKVAVADNTSAVTSNTEAILALIEKLSGDNGMGDTIGKVGEGLTDALLNKLLGGGNEKKEGLTPSVEVEGLYREGSPAYMPEEKPSVEFYDWSAAPAPATAEDWYNEYIKKQDADDQYTEHVIENTEKRQKAQAQESKKEASSAQSAFAKMTQAANLYGIAYQAMSNDNMSASQKFGMIAIQAAGNAAMTGLTVSMSETQGKVASDSPAVLSKLWKQLGWAAVPVYAIFTGLLGGLMGLAASKIGKSKSEIAAATNTGKGGGRLVTGMLTYAEGNYPVLGADGHTYNAKYEGKPETGIYKGGARFGIFSEKKPEAIIDGDTTERILLDYPKIWQSILTIKKHGRLKEAYGVYAEGNLEEVAKRYGVNNGNVNLNDNLNDNGNENRNESSQSPVLEELKETIDTLSAILARGIGVRMQGEDGLEESLARRERFRQRNHIS